MTFKSYGLRLNPYIINQHVGFKNPFRWIYHNLLCSLDFYLIYILIKDVLVWIGQ